MAMPDQPYVPQLKDYNLDDHPIAETTKKLRLMNFCSSDNIELDDGTIIPECPKLLAKNLAVRYHGVDTPMWWSRTRDGTSLSITKIYLFPSIPEEALRRLKWLYTFHAEVCDLILVPVGYLDVKRELLPTKMDYLEGIYTPHAIDGSSVYYHDKFGE